ncbi:response regulator transcription factor, partial [Streptomyces sp. PU-14G]
MTTEQPPPGPEPVSVLLVDDHPVVRDGLRAMLERGPGFRVLGEAAGGVE